VIVIFFFLTKIHLSGEAKEEFLLGKEEFFLKVGKQFSIGVKILTECFSFPEVVPNLWNVDGEVTVPEQKPGEIAEELASSYERKLIEVRPPGRAVYTIVAPSALTLGTPGKVQPTQTGTSAKQSNNKMQKESVYLIRKGGIGSLKI
jgi:hypothetical protein